VLEDVTEIILNLKQVRLKSTGDLIDFSGERVELNIKGKEVFTRRYDRRGTA
jgi:DNA-directed RNA polymerase alpha subunit